MIRFLIFTLLAVTPMTYTMESAPKRLKIDTCTMLTTTNGYTQKCQLCNYKEYLWDREMLIKLLREHNIERHHFNYVEKVTQN